MSEDAGFVLLDACFEINLADTVKSSENVVLEEENFAFAHVRQLCTFGIEDLLDYGLKVLTFIVVKVELTRGLDELHHLKTVAVCLYPKFVFRLFGLDLGQHVEEHAIHLVHKVVEVGTTHMCVVVYLFLDF